MGSPSARVPRARLPLGALRAIAVTLAVTALDALLLALALGGADRLLAHPRALALLALWGTSSLVTGLVHPVSARPTAETHTDRALIAALLLIPLLTPPLAAWSERHGLWLLPGGEALGWAGVALAALGLALRMTAMIQLGPRFAPAPSILIGHELETRGAYGLVRHPGYLGAWIANLGAALAFTSAPGLAGVLLLAMALGLRVRSEEALLESHFGERYRDYRTRTGRVFPRWPVSRA